MRLIWISLLLAAALAAAPADLIVSAGKVVTMDGQRRVIDDGAVAIQGGRIAAVGPRANIEKAWQAARRISRPDAILLPGLVNTHAHAPMSLLRGLADDLQLKDWLEKHIFPAEAKNVNEAFVRAGTRLAVLEMLLSGVTTYADMYYFEDAVADETRKAGMRGVLGETIIGFPVPDHKTPELALEWTRKYIRRFKGDPLITPAVAPHAIYTNSDATLKASKALADELDVPLLIHLAETATEMQDIEKRGSRPALYLDKLDAYARRTLVAHAVHCDSAEMRVLKAHNAGVAHCPSSNLKLASGVANIPEMLRLGIAVGLGTDGPAGSNNDFDLMEEMDLASKIQKVFRKDPTVLPAQTMVEMATIQGARAMGMDRQIGSLEPGKRADLITLSLAAPRAWPAHDVYSMIVYTLKGSDVQDVLVEGRVLIENRKPLTLNPAAIRAEAEALRKKVDLSLRN
jgi:5-methylthioadenosine/S-adenosylhomocysteine deaminase